MPRIRIQLEELPALLKKARQRKRLSREQLALQIGVSFSSIRDYEQGRRRPSIQNLQNIAKFLEVELPSEYTQDYY